MIEWINGWINENAFTTRVNESLERLVVDCWVYRCTFYKLDFRNIPAKSWNEPAAGKSLGRKSHGRQGGLGQARSFNRTPNNESSTAWKPHRNRPSPTRWPRKDCVGGGGGHGRILHPATPTLLPRTPSRCKAMNETRIKAPSGPSLLQPSLPPVLAACVPATPPPAKDQYQQHCKMLHDRMAVFAACCLLCCNAGLKIWGREEQQWTPLKLKKWEFYEELNTMILLLSAATEVHSVTCLSDVTGSWARGSVVSYHYVCCMRGWWKRRR